MRCLALGGLLAMLPLSIVASTVTVDYGIELNGLAGTGSFTYDPSLASTAGGLGAYADPADGLESFDLSYGGTTYTNASASLLDASALPTVFLPGNSTIPAGLDYGFLGLWVVSGSCAGSGGSYTCTGPGGSGDATVLGIGRSTEAFLASGVSSVLVSDSGSDLTYNLGSAPDLSVITGTITSEYVAATPEPAALPLVGAGMGLLWLARRRKHRA